MLLNGSHLGRFGLRVSRILASWGSRFPLRALQGRQELTTFSHVVLPPLSLGKTWSRLRSSRWNVFPQYWHLFLSRSKIPCRVNFISLLGNLSNRSSMMILGIRILSETLCIIPGPGFSLEKSCQLRKSKVRKFSCLSDNNTT